MTDKEDIIEEVKVKEPLPAPEVNVISVTCAECTHPQDITAEKSFVCQSCRKWNQYPPVENTEEVEDKPKKKKSWLS